MCIKGWCVLRHTQPGPAQPGTYLIAYTSLFEANRKVKESEVVGASAVAVCVMGHTAHTHGARSGLSALDF